ncbi:MAG TPA: ATP-binding protein [Gaiellaceae bacterium]|nr:ATP-binding protein [Gaiellaceae bacterium]
MLVLLVLPFAVGAWTVAGSEAARARMHAETALQRTLRQASTGYRDVLAAAARQSHALASSRRVQRAFEHRDRRALRRLAPPNVRFDLGPSLPAAEAGVASRSTRIVVGKRWIGAVTVRVPLDHRLLVRLEHTTSQPNRELAFAHGRSLVLPSGASASIPAALAVDRPSEIPVGRENFVAVSTPLSRENPGIRLAALAPAAEILRGANATRLRLLLAGLGILVAVALAAYAFAPLLGRNRFARQQRDQAARVLSHLGEGVFLVDSGGVIRLWNAAAETITGLAAQEMAGVPAETALPGWRELAARVPTSEADETYRPATIPLELDGRELWLSIAGVQFGDGTVYAFRDATSEHRLEAIRAEFVATVSHELRTPLAALHGAALTLTTRGEELPEETRGMLLAMIGKQSKRLASLVEDILLAGQLDAGSLRVEREPFNAAAVARAAVDEARQRAATKAMLRVSAAEDLPRVLGDEGRTHQVLANLIDNAVKYSPAGSRVDIDVKREQGRVRFSVRDRGPGIPRAEQEHVFEKFYRLDPDHRYGVGGSGLGLYICRQLVSSMQGRIWVEPAPRHGSIFTFELPVA